MTSLTIYDSNTLSTLDQHKILLEDFQSETVRKAFCETFKADENSISNLSRSLANFCKVTEIDKLDVQDLIIKDLIQRTFPDNSTTKNSLPLEYSFTFPDRNDSKISLSWKKKVSILTDDEYDVFNPQPKIKKEAHSHKELVENLKSFELKQTFFALLERMDPEFAYLEALTLFYEGDKFNLSKKFLESLAKKIAPNRCKMIEEAAIINHTKSCIPKGIYHDDLMQLVPFLTHVDLSDYRSEWFYSENVEMNNLIAACKQASYIKIHCSKLTKIDSLPHCKILNCSSCDKLTSISNLPLCTDLDCSGTSIKQLPKLPSCINLNCKHCRQLSLLPELQFCKKLNCGHCISLELLPLLPLCEELTCDNCDKLTFLPQLTSCLSLNCSLCPLLTEIPDIPHCLKLYCFRCTNLKKLPLLPQCTILDCGECPLIEELPYLPFCTFLSFYKSPKITSLPVLNSVCEMRFNDYMMKNSKKLQQFFINPNEIKNSPIKVLNHYCEVIQYKPKIIFIDEQGDQSHSVDQGGLLRQFIADLFQALFDEKKENKQDILTFRREEEGIIPLADKNQNEMKEHYKKIGKLFAFLLDKKLPIGMIFSPKLFAAILVSLNEKNSDDAEAKIYCILMGLEHVYSLLEGNSTTFSEAGLKQIHYFSYSDQVGEIVLNAPKLENFKFFIENHRDAVLKSIKKQIPKNQFVDENQAIHSIAEGLKISSRLSIIKTLNAQNFKEEIEGSLTYTLVLKSLKFSTSFEGEKDKKEQTVKFLREWLISSTQKDVSLFVRAVCGSISLHQDQSLCINLISPKNSHTLPSSQTCFFQLNLPINYENQEVFNQKMHLFIKHSCSGTGFGIE